MCCSETRRISLAGPKEAPGGAPLSIWKLRCANHYFKVERCVLAEPPRWLKLTVQSIFSPVLKFITHTLDRWAIQSACRSVRSGDIEAGLIDQAEAMLAHEDFFAIDGSAPKDWKFHGSREFRFQSRVRTPCAENNTVYGKFYRADLDGPARPAVLLVHGWNGELGYHFQFPFLARLLNRSGLDAAMIELPYHARRRPRGAGTINNFISHDLVRMLEATQQAMADLRAVLGWLCARGSPLVGMWGVSLGAWLTGLVAATDPRAQFAVLMSPVVSLDHAIRDLAFCEPIRRSLGQRPFNVQRLNLASHTPHCGRDGVLILESLQDLFAPPETVEEVWKAWREPELWRLRHGHISVLASVPVMYRATRWLSRKTKSLLAIDRLAAKG